MNKPRILYTCSALLLAFLFGRQATAQSPSPKPGPGKDVSGLRASLVTVVKGEARLVRNVPAVDALVCGASASRNIGTSYAGLYDQEEIILKFSFGRPSSGTPIGSWVVGRYNPRTNGTHWFFAGEFTGGNANLARSPVEGIAPGRFLLSGRTTFVDGFCFDRGTPKNIVISGSCQKSTDGISFRVGEPLRVFARGTFRNVISVSCDAFRPPSEVDRTLNRDTP